MPLVPLVPLWSSCNEEMFFSSDNYFLPSQRLAAAVIVYRLAVVPCAVVTTICWLQLLPVPSQRTLTGPSILIPAKNSSDRRC